MYKFNENKLLFEKTNILIKYKVIIGVLILSIFLLSFSAIKIKIKTEKLSQIIQKKEITIAKKEAKIKQIKEPLREDCYVEDLYKAIGFNLTEEQYERFSYLALKYKTQIEEAHVPATMVWYVAYKESGFDVKAKNPESSSKGLYQFINSTWDSMCKLNGENTSGRFDEEKQVRIMLVYVNYLYNRYQSWEKVMSAFRGFEPHYNTKFLFK